LLEPSGYQEPLTLRSSGWASANLSVSSHRSLSNILSSWARTEPTQIKELEDNEVEDKHIAPHVRKETQVLCVTRLYDISSEFTMDFHVANADLEKILLWVNAPVNVECMFVVLP